MRLRDIIKEIEEFAPLHYAEDFDNVGLLVGDANNEATGVLITLDTLEEVVDEAIAKNCNLIVSFHPIIFTGLKKLNGENYVERTVIKAIQHNIAIYAIHTALDNQYQGVNAMIAQSLGLINRAILIPRTNSVKKLLVFVPQQNAENVRNALFNVGAGSIGNYDNCSFSMQGLGSFRPNDEANPTIGEKGKLHLEQEIQLGVTFPSHLQARVLKALFSTHPYEEVAYEVTTLENIHQHLGMGMIGELEENVSEEAFLKSLKDIFKAGCVRHSRLLGKPVQKIAVLGGSGSFAIENAKKAGADIFITADLKYHDFYKAENQMILADIGHYESEQFTKILLYSFLKEKFRNFALILADTNTNPIKYI